MDPSSTEPPRDRAGPESSRTGAVGVSFGDRKKPLKSDPEVKRAFLERGRASGARSLKASAKRRGGVSPASPAQRTAVDGQPCIVCGDSPVDPAHLVARAHGGCDSPLCVVPLCRSCHRAFDDGELDLLAVLVESWERWRAHVQHMLCHANPVQMVERLAGARTQWSDLAPPIVGRDTRDAA